MQSVSIRLKLIVSRWKSVMEKYLMFAPLISKLLFPLLQILTTIWPIWAIWYGRVFKWRSKRFWLTSTVSILIMSFLEKFQRMFVASPRFHSSFFLTGKKDEVSHSFLISISQTIERDLKNIDERTMNSSKYYETNFYLFDRDCLYEQNIKNALTGKVYQISRTFLRPAAEHKPSQNKFLRMPVIIINTSFVLFFYCFVLFMRFFVFFFGYKKAQLRPGSFWIEFSVRGSLNRGEVGISHDSTKIK